MTGKNTILVVDDKSEIVKLTERFLKLGGFTVIIYNPLVNRSDSRTERIIKHLKKNGIYISK